LGRTGVVGYRMLTAHENEQFLQEPGDLTEDSAQ
jgi:hypothetical protein